MNYSIENKGLELIVHVDGRLDVNSADKVQQAVAALDTNGKKLYFDFKNLEYISSVGMRVVLSAAKKVGKDSFKVINANDAVYDIFNVAGFDAVINIEKVQAALDTSKLLNLSFREVLAKLTAEKPDFVFIKHMGNTYTYSEIDKCSDIIAAELYAQGVRKGTHVGICTANSANWGLTFFAVQKLGAVACLLNFNYTASELKLVSEIGDITHLCYGEMKAAGELEQVVNQPDSRIIAAYNISSTINFKERMAENVAFSYDCEIYSDDVCVMIYTSGSTGRPKGVLLSAYNLLNASIRRAEAVRLADGDKLCLILPLFHIFGLTAGFFSNALFGGSIVIPASIKTGVLLDTIESEKCTLFHSVPTMVLAIMNNEAFAPKRVESLRCVILSGAATTEPQMLNMMQVFPNVHFIVCYGLSEMSPASATEYDETVEHLCRSVGKPIKDIEVMIADPATDAELEIGQIGEIRLRGFNLMCGYYKMGLDSQAVDGEGWLHTGDLGNMDSEGYLHITGRIKELIIRGGENIMPNEIAAVISRHEDIADVKVVGVPDDFYGEVVCACVAMKNGKSLDEAAMNTFLTDKLAKYKIPAYYMQFDELPKLANGKVDAVLIKKLAGEKFAKAN